MKGPSVDCKHAIGIHPDVAMRSEECIQKQILIKHMHTHIKYSCIYIHTHIVSYTGIEPEIRPPLRYAVRLIDNEAFQAP